MINPGIILLFLGILITSLSLAMSIPLLVEIHSSGINIENFLICTIVSLFIGVTLVLAFKKKKRKLMSKILF